MSMKNVCCKVRVGGRSKNGVEGKKENVTYDRCLPETIV